MRDKGYCASLYVENEYLAKINDATSVVLEF